MRLTKFVKKQVSKLLCGALLLSSVAAVGEIRTAQALSKNDIETDGTILTLGEPATGVLEEADEQDWFIFDITQRGYFSVDLQINDNADMDLIRGGWTFSVYHAEDWVNPISTVEGITTNEAGKGRELPMAEGRYYICVSHGGYYQPLGCPYDVKVNFTPTEEWEVEDNDSNAEANVIELNKTYSGIFQKEGDVDWYKVTTPNNGTLQLDFGPDASTDSEEINGGWSISILDEGAQLIKEYNTKTKLVPQFLPFAKGTFYIKVASGGYYQPFNCVYNLQLNFTETQDWEKEYNNESGKATDITSGKEYHGVLSWQNDVDWYRIDNETDVDATLQFRVDSSNSIDDIRNGWRVEVYNEVEKSVLGDEAAKKLGEITKTTTLEGIRLTKGLSYVKVYYNYYQPIDCLYHLTVTTTPVGGNDPDTSPSTEPTETPDTTPSTEPTETPDTTPSTEPTGTPAPSTKPTATPTNTSKPSNTTKPNNTSGSNNTNTGNQTTKVTNEEMQKVIVTSTVTTSTVISKNKRSVYLRWKKQKYAGGYEIYRSTKKKKGFKKVKTINKGSKVSWTDTKVKGGKTYYYKIRAFRKIGGKKSVSGFSKVKQVKVKK